MNNYKILQSAVLLTLLTTGSYASNDGFYMGANAAFISLGDDSMTVTHKDKTKTTYDDISSSSFGLKAGYEHFDGNRVELYFKQNELDTKEGDISTKTFGVNYEWGFSSLSFEKLLPYASIGFGVGKSSSTKLKVVDDIDLAETTFGLGVRYEFNENIDAQIGYVHTVIGFDSSKVDNDLEIDQDNILLSVAYKF